MWKALIKLVEKWAYRCEHDWEFTEKTKIYDDTGTLPIAIRSSYICKKCLKDKTIKL